MVAASAVWLCAPALAPAFADQPAINLTTVGVYPPLSPNGFNYYQPPGGYTFTFDFKANSAIAVTQLGYYNSALGGVAEPSGFGTHTVSLVDVTTNQTLATTTVTATSPATGLFNYATIASKTLNTSDTYRVQGTMTNQYYAVGVNSSAAKVASAINYLYQPQDIFGTNGPAGTLDDFGPDFQFVTATTGPTQAQVASSINSVAVARESQMVNTRVLGSILLGANEQVNCSSCGSGFASFGSFALGAHGRWNLTDSLSVLGGLSVDQFAGGGVDVSLSPMVAGAVRYDVVEWGRSRPFFEAGVSAAPYEQASFTRNYPNGSSVGVGRGSAIDHEANVYGRVGWVVRPTAIEEAAVYVDLTRSWDFANAYTEISAATNPFPASYSSGVDSLNTARIGAQYTRLLTRELEVNVNAGLAHGFGGSVGVNADVSGYGAIGDSSVAPSVWAEYGARIGYHLSERMVLDTFVLGTSGGGPAGGTIHAGLGLRYAF